MLEVIDAYPRSRTQKHALVARKLQALYAPAPTLPESFQVLLQRLDRVAPAHAPGPTRKPGST